MESVVKLKLKDITLLSCHLILILIFSLWANGARQFSSYSDYNNTLVYFMFLFIFMQGLTFKVRHHKFYDVGLIFVILSYMFMFGHRINTFFSLETTMLWNPGANFSLDVQFTASVFILLCLEFFVLGYIYSDKPVYIQTLNSSNVSTPLFQAGLVMFFIGTFAKILTDFGSVEIAKKYGSYLYYSQAASSGIVDDISFFMIPGVIFLLFSGKLSKSLSTMLTSFSTVYLIYVMLATGSRKISLFLIIGLVLSYMVSQNIKINWKVGLIGTIGSVIFLDMIYVIREYRFNLNQVIPKFIDSLKHFTAVGNILGEVFAETGASFYAVASIIKFVPDYFPFEYGTTFLRAIPSMFPIGWLVGDFFTKASSTAVINTFTQLPVGGSVYGDLFWNFGFLGGILSTLIFGILTRKVFHIDNQNIRFSLPMYFSLLSVFLILVRSVFIEIFKPMTWIFLFGLILFRIFSEREAE